MGQTIYVSATPAKYELEKSEGVIIEQVVRPTGLVDPRGGAAGDQPGGRSAGRSAQARGAGRARAGDHADQADGRGPHRLLPRPRRARALHARRHETLERIELVRELRQGEYDVLVGINLLREGLDIPEVSLVAILDADKEGFLRSETSLIQTCGRAARNLDGRVIMYASLGDRLDEAGAGRDGSPPREAARLQQEAQDHAAIRSEERSRIS
jgi:excinuclease ABC subunit B